MRQFLIAFVCLSTLAMAQNVVVATPLSAESADSVPVAMAATEVGGSRYLSSAALSGSGVPEPAAMVLMVAGLSGLTAVGGRNQGQKKQVSE